MTESEKVVMGRMGNAIAGMGVIILLLLFIIILMANTNTTAHSADGSIDGPIDYMCVTVEEYIPAELAHGLNLFKVNCATCHFMSDMKLTGPGLHDTKSHWPYNTWFEEYITNEDSLMQSQEPYTLALNKEWGDFNTHNFGLLNAEEIRQLKAYVMY